MSFLIDTIKRTFDGWLIAIEMFLITIFILALIFIVIGGIGYIYEKIDDFCDNTTLKHIWNTIKTIAKILFLIIILFLLITRGPKMCINDWKTNRYDENLEWYRRY